MIDADASRTLFFAAYLLFYAFCDICFISFTRSPGVRVVDYSTGIFPRGQK